MPLPRSATRWAATPSPAPPLWRTWVFNVMVNLLEVRSSAKTVTWHGVSCRVGLRRLAELGGKASLAQQTADPSQASARKLASLLRARLVRLTLDGGHVLGGDLGKPPVRPSGHISNPHAFIVLHTDIRRIYLDHKRLYLAREMREPQRSCTARCPRSMRLRPSRPRPGT